MQAPDWLPAEVVDALEAEYGTLVEALLYQLAWPGSGDRLRDLGVIDRSRGFGDLNVYVPRASEREVWEFMAALHGFEIAGELAPAPAGADDLLERVVALLTREQPAPTRRKPGVKPTDVPPKTKRRVAELRIAGDGVAAIRRGTGLSKTVATRLVRDVDDALGAIRAGRY